MCSQSMVEGVLEARRLEDTPCHSHSLSGYGIYYFPNMLNVVLEIGSRRQDVQSLAGIL